MWNELGEKERNEFTQYKRLTNLIVCSYSRLACFIEVQPEVPAAAGYDIVAHSWCPHSRVYVYDEEGIVTTYILSEGLSGTAD